MENQKTKFLKRIGTSVELWAVIVVVSAITFVIWINVTIDNGTLIRSEKKLIRTRGAIINTDRKLSRLEVRISGYPWAHTFEKGSFPDNRIYVTGDSVTVVLSIERCITAYKNKDTSTVDKIQEDSYVEK